MSGESLLASYVVVGVTISGFSGIVAALGSHARGEWSHRDRQLMYALLGSSGGSALLSALPLFLASARLDETTVWAASSCCSVVLQLGLMALRAWGMAGAVETFVGEWWVLAVAYAGGRCALRRSWLIACGWA
jgi:hypothetical protein